MHTTSLPRGPSLRHPKTSRCDHVSSSLGRGRPCPRIVPLRNVSTNPKRPSDRTWAGVRTSEGTNGRNRTHNPSLRTPGLRWGKRVWRRGPGGNAFNPHVFFISPQIAPSWSISRVKHRHESGPATTGPSHCNGRHKARGASPERNQEYATTLGRPPGTASNPSAHVVSACIPHRVVAPTHKLERPQRITIWRKSQTHDMRNALIRPLLHTPRPHVGSPPRFRKQWPHQAAQHAQEHRSSNPQRANTYSGMPSQTNISPQVISHVHTNEAARHPTTATPAPWSIELPWLRPGRMDDLGSRRARVGKAAPGRRLREAAVGSNCSARGALCANQGLVCARTKMFTQNPASKHPSFSSTFVSF